MNLDESKAKNKKENSLSSVLVKGLTTNVRSAHVDEIFSNFGKVENVQIAYFKGHSVGWAFVYFSNPKEAENAVSQMDGGLIDGVKISVELTETNISIEELFLKNKK